VKLINDLKKVLDVLQLVFRQAKSLKLKDSRHRECSTSRC
jgi:hypothetical protein